MLLKFSHEYLSIKELNDIELPDFTVLTGVNGSGKTHLLKAIHKKAIDTSIPIENISSFNASSFKLQDEQDININSLQKQSETLFNRLKEYGNLSQNNLKLIPPNELNHIKQTCKETKKPFYFNTLNNQLNGLGEGIKTHINNNTSYSQQDKRQLLHILGQITCPIEELKPTEFNRYYDYHQTEQNLIPTQFSNIFWRYYTFEADHLLLENERDSSVANKKKFIERYGPPPWETLNELLEGIPNIPYQISNPKDDKASILDTYGFRLINKTRPEIRINFSSLSSGEKILMAMIATIYQIKIESNKPQLVLLDEIDASLHPSMSEILIKVIKETLIKQDIKVILVTHSPSTVAFAPEGSTYVMNKSGPDRIKKVNKQDAINVLSDGLVSLADGVNLLHNLPQKKVLILSEGRNINFINKALELSSLTEEERSNIDIIPKLEGLSGKEQLKHYFDFLNKIPHEQNIIVVWDNDAKSEFNKAKKACSNLDSIGKTLPFKFEDFSENKIAKNGIENLFDENLFDGFINSVEDSYGIITKSFHKQRKSDFESFILNRNNPDDFKNFAPLIDLIKNTLAEENREQKAAD